MKKGSITVYQVKEVVEDVYDSQLEISLEEARELKKAYELGDKIKFKVTPKTLGELQLKQPSKLLCSE